MSDTLELSRKIAELSDAFNDACLEMGEISERAGLGWLELRKECKTDAECNKKWATTADGRRAEYLKWFIKGAERKISADKMRLRMLTGQGA